MQKAIAVFCFWLIFSSALPLLGSLGYVDLRGLFVNFPRTEHSLEHAEFSILVFLLGLFAGVVFFSRIFKYAGTRICLRRAFTFHCFPSWGYAGLLLLLSSWILAWSPRLPFELLRQHSFVGLWLGYVVIARALVASNSASAGSQISHRQLSVLFLISGAFWWFFEFENRFVQNWHYIGAEQFGNLHYLLHATIAFSTVLPAVSLTAIIIHNTVATVPPPVPPPAAPRYLRSWTTARLITVTLLFGILPLLFLGRFPNELFPALWISPLLILVGLERCFGIGTIFSGVPRGHFRKVISWGCSGVVCGLFWELWNFYSLPKWLYAVPYVDRLHLFEMPLLGYAGYFPFGLLCGSLVELFGVKLQASSGNGDQKTCDEIKGSQQLAAPRHVAIIMDGNGRWAEQRNLPRYAGHGHGAARIGEIVAECRRCGVRYLTLFAFSTENWQRPSSEVAYLMSLFSDFLKAERERLAQNQVRLVVSGDLSKLPPGLREEIRKSEQLTATATELTLVLAISYGGRQEILDAVRLFAEAIKTSRVSLEQLTEGTFRSFFRTAEIPDPDLIIRTSNEKRLSNFLIWQAAYSELIFVPTLWPDFSAAELQTCILEYQARNRRFGRIASTSAA